MHTQRVTGSVATSDGSFSIVLEDRWVVVHTDWETGAFLSASAGPEPLLTDDQVRVVNAEEALAILAGKLAPANAGRPEYA